MSKAKYLFKTRKMTDSSDVNHPISWETTKELASKEEAYLAIADMETYFGGATGAAGFYRRYSNSEDDVIVCVVTQRGNELKWAQSEYERATKKF